LRVRIQVESRALETGAADCDDGLGRGGGDIDDRDAVGHGFGRGARGATQGHVHVDHSKAEICEVAHPAGVIARHAGEPQTRRLGRAVACDLVDRGGVVEPKDRARKHTTEPEIINDHSPGGRS
jgi:hypothetical protein